MPDTHLTDSSSKASQGMGIDKMIAYVLPRLMQRAMQKQLHGVYMHAHMPTHLPDTALIVANHHSWWDGYLVWLLRERMQRPMNLIMRAQQLDRFRFFRHLGVFSEREVRAAIKRLQKGVSVVIFAEGQMNPPGRVHSIRPGASFLATRAEVPILPLGIRLVIRGAQHPEAFLSLGNPLAANATDAQIMTGINAQLENIEQVIAQTDAETIPDNFSVWLHGSRGLHERMAWVERFWQRKT